MSGGVVEENRAGDKKKSEIIPSGVRIASRYVCCGDEKGMDEATRQETEDVLCCLGVSLSSDRVQNLKKENGGGGKHSSCLLASLGSVPGSMLGSHHTEKNALAKCMLGELVGAGAVKCHPGH